MCGITGFIDFTKSADKEVLSRMTDILYHRGPDDTGCSFYSNEYANIGLGHRRLSILDLSSQGHQPMTFENLEIVFNGEIYNFKGIRNRLAKDGFKFESESDTEVLLKAFHKWGTESVNEFNGMFAFAVFDKKSNTFTLARDRIGKKPLYYCVDDDKFIFASELKSILLFLKDKPRINKESLSEYLQLGYIGHNKSIYENIYKLPKSSYLVYQIKNKKYNISEYKTNIEFDVDFNSYQEVKENLKNLLIDSVQKRMISDVPIGSFLSGGIDSCLITSIMQSLSNKPINTFTIGFRDSHLDEAVHASKVASYLNTKHHEKYFNEEDLMGSFDLIIDNMDEPFYDHSIFPTFMLSELTKENVTVALSGDGGDELFCGYKQYFYMNSLYGIYKLPQTLRNIIFKPIEFINISKYKRLFTLLTLSKLSDIHRFICDNFQVDELKDLLNEDVISDGTDKCKTRSDFITSGMFWDQNNYLTDDIMVKVDRASMLASLETRSPLLDYRIVEYANRIPLKFKLKNFNNGKFIIKDILKEFLPEKLWDRKKQGFTIPLYKWLSGFLKEDIFRVLSRDFIIRQNLFDYRICKRILDDHYHNNYLRTPEIWNIYLFQKWWEKHYEK